MKRFLANWELKVLAVLSAIIFWILVIGTENTFYTFPDPIPVKVFNLADDLVVDGELPTVSLRLKIDNRESLKNLTIDDFSAFIDLEGQREGTVRSRVEVTSKNSDISFMKADPGEIEVRIEKISEKEVPIDYKAEGEVADGYQVKNVELSQDKVVVKGSQSTLKNVFQATALINLSGDKEDLSITAPLVVFDKQGNKLDNIKFENPEVDALITITPIKNQKILGVQPNITGKPDDSVWIKSIDVNPSYIVAEGDQDVLEKLDFVKTEDINVDGLKENKTYNVSIADLPDGISVQGGGNVVVSIEVQSYNSANSNLQRKTINVPLVIKKFKSVQRGSSLDPSSVTLVVEGTPESLSQIDTSLRLDIDISGVKTSGGTIEINKGDFNLPDGVGIVSLIPQAITVTWD